MENPCPGVRTVNGRDARCPSGFIANDIGTRLRVDNVMDLAEERPMNLIHGQHVFRVAGYNMVLLFG